MRNWCTTITNLLFVSVIISQPTVTDLVAPSEIEEGAFETYRSIMTDPLGLGLTCTWDFGDGSTKRLLDRSSTGHVYSDDGTYSLKVTVEDDDGREASISLNVTVKNVDPEIRLLKGVEDERGEKRALLEAVVHDPGDDDIYYSWDFGDGQQREGRHLNKTTHVYSEKGVYTVRLTVDDDDGGVDYKTVIVRIDEDWGANVSGFVSSQLKGGTGLLYNRYVNDNTGALSGCFKQVLLFDDEAHTFIVFGLKDMNPLTDYTHTVGTGGPHGVMSAFMHYNLPASSYPILKMRHLPMEVIDAANKRDLGELMRYANVQLPTGGVDYSNSILFTSVSGTFETEAIVGNSFKGTFNVTLESDDPHGRDNPPRIINVSGSFEAGINDFIAANMEDGCEDPKETFSLVRYSPKDNKENVHPEYPCFELEFSAPVDMQSLNEQSVRVGYYDANYMLKNAPLDFEQLSDSKIRVIPASPLRPGVKYTCFVLSGQDGVKNLDGGELEDDYEWKFSTLVEPSDARIRVYQSVLDVPLVEGKEAMVRIELFWDKPDDIAAESFVRKFPANVALMNAGGSRVCPDKRGAMFKHYDESTAEDVRFARNSVNVYGWEPSPSDGDQIEIEIKPLYQECVPEEEQIKYKLNHAIEHWDLSPRLHVQYYFLKIAEWEDGVPADAIAMGNEIMRKAMDFGQQVFPVRKMTSQNMGEAYVDPSLYLNAEDESGLSGMAISLWNQENFDEALRDFYFETGIYSQADVVVAFHPFILGQGGTGGALQSFGDSNPNPIPLNKRYLHMTVKPGAIPRAAIEHEIGHTFYLDHVPPADTREQRELVASRPVNYWEDKSGHYHIQGFRIYPGQDRGANKSCTEGNAEHGTMANIMFPDITNVHRHHAWINKKQVLRVMQNIEATGTIYASLDQSSKYDHYWVSLDDPVSGENTRTLYVTGSIEPMSSTASVTRAIIMKERGSGQNEEGAYQLRALDAKGNVVGKAYFDPVGQKYDCFTDDVPYKLSFFTQISIPQSKTVAILEVVKDGIVWDKFEVSVAAPIVSFSSPQRGDSLSGFVNVAWEGSDADSELLTYTLLYSANGIDDWKTLGSTRATSMTVNTSTLPSGESPAMRIQVSDGFNTGTDDTRVRLAFPISIESYGPRDTINLHDKFSATFTNELNPASLNDILFNLREKESGKNVSSLVKYDPENRAAILTPLEPLIAGQTYIAQVGKLHDPAEYSVVEEADTEPESADPFSSFQLQLKALFDEQSKAPNKQPATTKREPPSQQNHFGGITDIYGNHLRGMVEWEVVVVDDN